MMRNAMAWGVGLLLLAGTSASAQAGKRYAGVVSTEDGGSLPLSLSVDSLTSDDRTLELAQLLHDEGIAAVAAAIGADRAGTLTVGANADVPANVVRSYQDGETLVISVLTHQPLETSPDDTPASGGVGFVVLQLGSDGTGSGRLIPSADIAFDEEGFLQPRSTDGRALAITDVTSAR